MSDFPTRSLLFERVEGIRRPERPRTLRLPSGADVLYDWRGICPLCGHDTLWIGEGVDGGDVGLALTCDSRCHPARIAEKLDIASGDMRLAEVPDDNGELPAAVLRDDPRVLLKAAVERPQRRPPTWAGARSYMPCWEACSTGAASEWTDSDHLSAAGRAYLMSESRLFDAHVLTIPPEQVRMLPVLGVQESVELLQDYRLPFDPLFVDTTASDGEAVSLGVVVGEEHRTSLSFVGFLIWRGDEDDCVHVVPFTRDVEHERSLDPWHHETVGEAVVWDPGALEREIPSKLNVWRADGVDETPVLGVGYFYDSERETGPGLVLPATPRAAYERREKLARRLRLDDDAYLTALEHARFSEADSAERITLGTDDGWTADEWQRSTGADVTDPATRARIAGAMAGAIFERDGRTLAFATVAYLQLASAVLYFLDAQQVEIASGERRMERRDVKRAVKRGWRIADTVVVRHRLSGPAHGATNGSRTFSHQFERAGNYHHVTRGPHVRCRVCFGRQAAENAPPCAHCNGSGVDPERVTPCRRRDATGALTCPHGCRREWHPPTVVGPEDKPLMLKTRVVRSPAGEGAPND